MNIVQYLLNPMGKGSSVLMLAPVRQELDRQYSDLLSKMSVKWYSIGEKYLVGHVKVPSHTIEKMEYDVLIEVDVESIPKNTTVINNGNVRVFSNCPSFTFTYVKVFNDNGNLIDWTRSKYDKEVFKEDPVRRNPAKITSYERSLYLAFKYITSAGRNYKSKIEYKITQVKSTKEILQNVKSSKEILDDYNTGKKKQEEKEKKISSSSSDNKKEPIKSSNNTTQKYPNRKGMTKTIKKTKKVKSTAKIKKSKKV